MGWLLLRRSKMKNDIRVLNKKHIRGSVKNAAYVGRPSIWGNPFVIGKDGSREDVIAKYEAWIAAARSHGAAA
jgi:Domain of unknown function (DUF4326)